MEFAAGGHSTVQSHHLYFSLRANSICASLTGAASTVRHAQPPSGSGGGGVRDVYAATYQEASQQVRDDYYLRSGDSAARSDTMRKQHGEAGKRAASAREQVSSALVLK